MKIKRFLIPALSLGTALCVSVGVLGMSSSELAASVEARQASVNVMSLSSDSSYSGTVTAEWPEGVSSEENFSYSKSGYRNAYEKLMAEDGFIYGMDYDWVKHNMDFSWSLGDSEIFNHAAAYSESAVAVDLYNIKALGFNAVNMWLFGGLSGMTFDHDTGYVTGLNDTFKTNLISFLNIAREYDLKVVLSFQPHSGFSYGDIRDGLSEQDVRNRYLQFYYKDEAREAYMNNAIKPLCNDIIKYYQDVVIICDLTVENGADEVDDDELGMYCYNSHGTTWENFGKFFCAMRDCVREAMPDMMISTEDMYYAYTAYKYNDFDVDLHGFNWYSSNSALPETSELYSNTPIYISEINVTEDKSLSYSDEYWQNLQMQYYEKAQKQGYVGTFYFSWWAGAGNFTMFDESTLNFESMRNVAQYFVYQFNDLKNKYRGITDAVDKPVLLCNRGGSEVYWFPGRGMNRFDLQRSDDGGVTWNTVASNISESSGATVLDNGLYKYVDNTVGAGMNYQYRVKAYNDEDGVSSVSEPNNRTEFFVAEDMMVNGDFEDLGSFSDIPAMSNEEASVGSGWYTAGRTVGVITSDGAYSGSKAIEIDTEAGKGETGWAKLHQKVKLTPGATYEVSMWYKSVESDKNISLLALTSNEEYIYGSFISTPEDPDSEWHQTKFLFTAPADGECIIGIWNYDWGYQKGFIDKVELYEVR